MKIYIVTCDNVDGNSIEGVFKNADEAENLRKELQQNELKELKQALKNAIKKKDEFWIKEFKESIDYFNLWGHTDGGDSYNVSEYEVQ